MQHIGVLFFNDFGPAFFRNAGQSAANGFVPHHPSFSIQDRVCIGDWSQLEFWRRRKSITGQNLSSFPFLLGIPLPFDVAFPSPGFFREGLVTVLGPGTVVEKIWRLGEGVILLIHR